MIETILTNLGTGWCLMAVGLMAVLIISSKMTQKPYI